MTLGQLRVYSNAAVRNTMYRHLNNMTAVRVAQHADADDYNRITGDIMRDMNK